MDWVFLETKQNGFLSPLPQPYFLRLPPPPPEPNVESSGFSLDNKVSPSILLIIIILAIIFFVSGLLHLLVRYLLRPPSYRDPDEMENVTALQGQLQQLFTLHDAGVDQSFIDTLPVFNYKSIIGVKNPFDCAVCLCEFEAEDKLRLLPKCSHAFHMDCIDTWLLSHSTCPLCRGSLLPDFSPNNCCSPVVLVLESGSESSRDVFSDTNSIARVNSQLGIHCSDDLGVSNRVFSHKSSEIQVREDENQEKKMESEGKEKVVTVKLGKYKNVDGGGEGSSTNNVDARRCFSMGSFEYVLDENSSLQVPIRTPVKKQSSGKKSCLPLTPGHKPAMSECGCDSRRDFSGFEALKFAGDGDGSNRTINGNGDYIIGRSKRESFSMSKIWLRGKKERSNSTTAESSRRAFSFRFPVHRNVVPSDGLNLKSKIDLGSTRRTASEIDIRRWENGGSEDYDPNKKEHVSHFVGPVDMESCKRHKQLT
ncbi:hypothetical protein RJ639_008321 [Escallonia herrerae]|uniref:RING-type E3 ubiquitin transferase n=1 Tax=Escallonia herrerae TaxID=1293975 RepID=A0AA88VSJ0_9ASTE|nr:hypothetical protein RJ639_008321 [Escallonia herrerae]